MNIMLHMLISYIDNDWEVQKSRFTEWCDDDCSFSIKGKFRYKNSDINWLGDIKSVDEYAKMILNYIKDNFEK